MRYDTAHSKAISESWRDRPDYHGGRRTRLYTIWVNMRGRCTYDSFDRGGRYKARGITYCQEWGSFVAFRDWALANGYEDHLTIERIDNDGNYEPSNCKWITKAEQARNRSSSVFIEAWGEGKTLAEWARDPRCTVSRQTISNKLKKGLTPEEAITLTFDASDGRAMFNINRRLASGN